MRATNLSAARTTRRISGLTAVAALAVMLVSCDTAFGSDGPGEAPSFAMAYPDAKTVDRIDDMHGTDVADPYRWLEEFDSDDAQAWLREQDGLLKEFVADVEGHAETERRILDYQTYDRISAPIHRGERSFVTIRPAGKILQQIWVERGGERELLIDFHEALVETQRIRGTTLSLDGSKMVVQVAEAQSRWPELRVLDTTTGEWGPEALNGYLTGRGGIAWDATADGFFYTRFEVPEAAGGLRTAVSDVKLFYHRLGTDQSSDVLVYERPDQPSWFFFPAISLDGRYLTLSLTDPAMPGNRLYYFPMTKGTRPWGDVVELIDTDDAMYTFEGTAGDELIVRTTLDAPNQRLVKIDPARPDPSQWVEIIPERDFPIGWVSLAKNAYLVPYRVDSRSTLRIHELDGSLRHEIDFTGQGFLFGLPDSPDRTTVHFGLNILYDPGSVYQLDIESGATELYERPELTYDPDRYTFEQVFYESFDGTRVPMFLVHRADIEPDSNTPVLMYAYGASGWSAFPWYQPEFIPWLDLGGVYALPGIRGGGEYGNDWWEAGRILNKETVIGDYIAAAEFLVESGRTSPRYLVGNGGSASGVLPAISAMRRPELFAATLIQYPTLDMLRYHLFGGWPSEFGTADDPEEFEVLRRISPYHGIDPSVCYPPMIVQAGALDEVTSPVHAYKFAAAMQGPDGAATRECGHPQLLKVAWEAGHSPGGTPEERAETGADQIAFLIKVLGLDPEGP
ncbi:MAG: prolyl oligopeptidase family serine peptidase [Gemmatimonadota bacterium]